MNRLLFLLSRRRHCAEKPFRCRSTVRRFGRRYRCWQWWRSRRVRWEQALHLAGKLPLGHALLSHQIRGAEFPAAGEGNQFIACNQTLLGAGSGVEPLVGHDISRLRGGAREAGGLVCHFLFGLLARP